MGVTVELSSGDYDEYEEVVTEGDRGDDRVKYREVDYRFEVLESTGSLTVIRVFRYLPGGGYGPDIHHEESAAYYRQAQWQGVKKS